MVLKLDSGFSLTFFNFIVKHSLLFLGLISSAPGKVIHNLTLLINLEISVVAVNEVDVEVNSLYFGEMEEYDNTWTSDTDSRVMVKSISIIGFKLLLTWMLGLRRAKRRRNEFHRLGLRLLKKTLR